jgi:fido (protein-threonine AMPylation protein)
LTEDDLHGGDGAATNLTPEERVGLIPTWIVTRDDLNRATQANIAAGRWNVRESLQVLTGDVAAQVGAGMRPPDEIAVDFHYRMVSIHLFPNGNGRHARLSADLLAGRLGREAFTWGRAELTDPGETRGAYIAALKAADGFDLEPLVAFART